MSSPTVGPEPNFTQGGAPEGQAGWSAAPPPPPGYGPAPTYGDAPAGFGGAAAAGRPGMVTGAAITGIVWGALGCLFGLIAVLALSVIFSYGGLGALFGIFALLGLAVSVALLVAGIQALQGKSPKLLLYISYASIVIQLLALIFAIASPYGFSFTSLLGFIVPGVIVALLWQPVSKQYYAARGITY
jgi:hypothetical protein